MRDRENEDGLVGPREQEIFDGAVELAQWFLERERYDEYGRDLYVEREYKDHQIQNIASHLVRLEIEAETEPKPINLAKKLNLSTPHDFRIKREMLAQKIIAGDTLNQVDRHIAADLVSGRLRPPRGNGGRTEGTSYFHSRIVWAVALASHEGLQVTRNDERKSQHEYTACDAVARALKSMRVGAKAKEYKTVKEIWLKGKWVVDVVEEFEELLGHDDLS